MTLNSRARPKAPESAEARFKHGAGREGLSVGRRPMHQIASLCFFCVDLRFRLNLRFQASAMMKSFQAFGA
eukprot:9584845-Alexandrium_andersonii.AAC.1